MKNMKLLFALLVFVSSSFCAMSQVPKEGWIVDRTTGDTIKGMVEDCYGKSTYGYQILFTGADGKKVKRYAYSLLAYNFGGDMYCSVDSKDLPGLGSMKYVFMKKLIEGNVILWKFEFTSGSYIYGANSYVPGGYGGANYGSSTFPDYAYFVQKKGEAVEKINPKKFDSEMSVYFAANAGLASKITNKEYLYGDMEKIVSEFNAAP